jgi:hypothetical protein
MGWNFRNRRISETNAGDVCFAAYATLPVEGLQDLDLNQPQNNPPTPSSLPPSGGQQSPAVPNPPRDNGNQLAAWYDTDL